MAVAAPTASLVLRTFVAYTPAMTSTSAPPASAPEEGTADLLEALVPITFITMGVLTKVAADNDLSLTQLRVLAILRDRRLRMSALADYLGLEKSTMSGLVDRAVKRGLLRRERSAVDARSVEVLLDQDGQDLADRLTREIGLSLSWMTGALTPADQRHLGTLLERVALSHRK